MVKPLTAIALNMRNFIANFAKVLGIHKDFTANRANELGTYVDVALFRSFPTSKRRFSA